MGEGARVSEGVSPDLNLSVARGGFLGILYKAKAVLLITMTTGSSSSGVVVGLIYALNVGRHACVKDNAQAFTKEIEHSGS